jgi:N-methylhydantoinase B
VLGDIHALVAANEFGARRLHDYLATFADEALAEITEVIARRSEATVRAAIARIPDGVYTSSVQLDGFEAPKMINVSVEVIGSSAVVDFDGTSEQSEYGINSGAPSVAYTLYSMKCILSPELPNNAWTYLPIEVRIPVGTLLNPRRPAPLSANFPAHLIQGALCLAFAQVDSERVMAPSGAPMWVIGIRGVDNEGPFATTLCFNGGQGALQRRNGRACLSMPSNVGNTPIETTEAECPILYEEKSIVRGSGGEGAWSGGDGQRVAFRSLHHDGLDLVLLTERLIHPAPGIAGGDAGRVGELLVDGRPVASPKGRLRLKPGSRLTLQTPGGGGFGVFTDASGTRQWEDKCP